MREDQLSGGGERLSLAQEHLSAPLPRPPRLPALPPERFQLDRTIGDCRVLQLAQSTPYSVQRRHDTPVALVIQRLTPPGASMVRGSPGQVAGSAETAQGAGGADFIVSPERRHAR